MHLHEIPKQHDFQPSRLKLDQDDLASLIHAGLEDRTFEHLKVFKKAGDYFNEPLAKDELHIVITSRRGKSSPCT